eukprot:COSAG06_NODE_21_length_33796_cov_70.184853_5_plen_608_part_00
MGSRYAAPALLVVAALTRRTEAVPQFAAEAAAGDVSLPGLGLGHMSRAFQLSCHSSGDAVADLPMLAANLAFVQGVCCSQLDESCGLGESLPTSCGEPACARVVELVSETCGPLLSNPDCFYCGGFKEGLDSATHVCADVHAQRTTYTMADPTLRLSPIVVSPGRLTDGMGVPGHWTATGQERVTIRAPAGQRVAFRLETQWLGSDDVLILYDGADESKEMANLRGTVLPADPLFVSTGAEMRVLLVTADMGEGVVTSFSALFNFICEDDVGCGGRGKCTEGRCDCPAGYFGDGCEDDSCVWKKCGSHGVCERGGTCRCMDGYSGEHCDVKLNEDGFAPAYNVSNCTPDRLSDCGLFRQTAEDCFGLPIYRRADAPAMLYFTPVHSHNDKTCDGKGTWRILPGPQSLNTEGSFGAVSRCGKTEGGPPTEISFQPFYTNGHTDRIPKPSPLKIVAAKPGSAPPPPLPLPIGYAEQYVISGCSDSSHCGYFVRTESRQCNGAPVYVLMFPARGAYTTLTAASPNSAGGGPSAPIGTTDMWDSGDVLNANGNTFSLYLLPAQPPNAFLSAQPCDRYHCQLASTQPCSIAAAEAGARGRRVASQPVQALRS